eukprot:834148-Rhodomonas_salina.3
MTKIKTKGQRANQSTQYRERSEHRGMQRQLSTGGQGPQAQSGRDVEGRSCNTDPGAERQLWL